MVVEKALMRFFAMYAPSQSIRVAMYRKAGVRIGRPLVFGSNIFIDVTSPALRYYGVTIGDYVVLAGYDHILTHSMLLWGFKRDGGPVVEGGSVVIKRMARIGLNVTILPGVTIGENAVVGAGSLVNKDIPDNCIAVGVPAKLIKRHSFRAGDGRHWLQDHAGALGLSVSQLNRLPRD